MGQAGASILKRHTFEIARHHVGQVGHVGHPTSTSKVYQRFSLPDMAFSMSGACRACRARPTSWGIMRDGWKAWAGCGPWEAWGDARHAGRLFSLGGGLSGRLCLACGLHAGRVWRLLKHSSRNHIFRVILGEISSEDTYNVLIGVHFRSFPTIFIGMVRKPAIPYNRLPLHNKKSYPRAMRHTAK